MRPESRRLAALKRALAAFEKRHGKISADELAEQTRVDRESAVPVRGRGTSTRTTTRTDHES